MGIIAKSLLEVLILVSLALILACLLAAIGGFIRYTTRIPANRISVYWLIRLGIFVGIPFSIVGMISGYMTGSSRVSAISNLIPASLTLIGGIAVYLFSKGGKSAVTAAFAVINFAIMLLVGVLIGGYERLESERIESSFDYQQNEINKEFLLNRYRRGLGMEDAPRAGRKKDE